MPHEPAPHPHPRLPLDQVLLGDCVEVLRQIPEDSVDLVFADPPYNLQLSQELHRPDRSRVNGVNDHWDQFDDFATYDSFTRDWLSACRRVLKPTGTLWVIGSYHNIYRVGAILQDLNFWMLNDIVWIKTNPMPNFRGVRFTNAHETLLWAQKERGARYTFNHHAMKSLNGDLQMRSDWELKLCVGKERLKVNGQKAHSTQKPESLLYRILLAATHPGDVVLDPFFGSGTSGAVARKLKRHWIGIEQEAQYVSLAQERITAIPDNPAEDAIFDTPNPRRQPRLPFGALLENGLLTPGQNLYFGEKSEITAAIMADGSLSYQDQRGSIHQIARYIRPGPANGWKTWYYQDPQSGQRLPIDRLRQQLRKAAQPPIKK
ncbi:MAG: site-specific DNA-methyltransferase [Anaerolineaceae bacterium]|nr:site-specific DNA-methyltransferase [Anaerolineaceae bacterium]